MGELSSSIVSRDSASYLGFITQHEINKTKAVTIDKKLHPGPLVDFRESGSSKPVSEYMKCILSSTVEMPFGERVCITNMHLPCGRTHNEFNDLCLSRLGRSLSDNEIIVGDSNSNN